MPKRIRDRFPAPVRRLISLLGAASIKVRLGVAIVSGVAASILSILVALVVHVHWALAMAGSALVSLVIIQMLAKGTTAPLRTMAAAAQEMASGHYDIRIPTDVGASEVRQLAQSFDAMAVQLAEVDRFRRDLIANAAHELRTPITVIRAVAENMVDGVSEPTPDQLRLLLGQAERLGRLVDQLLDLSRLESGVIPLRPTQINVGEMLNEVATTMRLRSEDVFVDVQVSQGLRVYADEERIRQVMTNLTDNALRHAPPGTSIRLIGEAAVAGTAVAGTAVAGAVGDRCILIVEDEGTGIPEADSARVFERFSRLDRARRTEDGGSGLGLSIVHWIVELHHGTIVPEHVHPTGCRMVVSLPGLMKDA
jgi:signal transduction histidine kinase